MRAQNAGQRRRESERGREMYKEDIEREVVDWRRHREKLDMQLNKQLYKGKYFNKLNFHIHVVFYISKTGVSK